MNDCNDLDRIRFYTVNNTIILEYSLSQIFALIFGSVLSYTA